MTAPVITSGNAFTINEGLTAIETVQASDPDGNPIAFSFKLGGTDNGLFKIDPATGALSFKVAPDFENPSDSDNNGIYTVTIQVKDTISGEVTLQTINITVADVVPVTLNGDGLDNVIGPTGTTFEGDTLNGLGGNDTLDGGLGADTMVGGTGNDTYFVDNTADIVTELTGEGTDKVFASVSYALNATGGVEALELTGTDDIDGTGNNLANTLIGNSGRNILNGGLGADTMTGGSDNDTYIVDNVGDHAIELSGVGTGTDTVIASVSYTLDANVENLTLTGATGTEVLNGTGNEIGNTITGNAANNILTGLAGNDKLDGGLGADTMIGGADSDEYTVDNVGDHVTELDGEGLDTVKSSVTFTLSANVERLFLQGTANINGTGQELANTITGNAGANILSGAGGDDILDGGAGADTLIGGLGDDTFIVDELDTVQEGSSSGGKDTVKAGFTYSLASLANVENITLTGSADINATGNALNNILTGNFGANVLTGGLGNDTYVVNSIADTVVELDLQGTDKVQATIGAGTTYTLANFVENLELNGLAASNGTGNGLDNVITGNSGNNVLSGLGGNDTLTGGIGTDTLLGGEGNDTLDGGFGNDAMTGGNGNDTYRVDSLTDGVTELAGGGTDTVIVRVSGYTLAAEVENLTLGGSLSINGSGNAGNNTITGNDGNNIINGGDGNDTVIGGKGNDTLLGGNGNDTINGGAGTDTITGGAGVDLMTGGLGNDTFVFTSATDSGATTLLGDQIMDYTTGDTISLAGIDAISSTAGVNEAFTVDTNGIFVAGEMKAVQTGNDVVVSLYTNNDQIADMVFTIHLTSGSTLVDFVL